MIAQDAGNKNCPRRGERLEPRRHVDPVAENATIPDHHISDMQPDAKQHLAVGGEMGVLGVYLLLDFRSAMPASSNPIRRL